MSLQLNVFLEGAPVAVTPPPTSMECRFSQKIYNVDMLENQSGRHRLAKVSSNCEEEHLPFSYVLTQATGWLFKGGQDSLQRSSN